jgi:hypothetical protein
MSVSGHHALAALANRSANFTNFRRRALAILANCAPAVLKYNDISDLARSMH